MTEPLFYGETLTDDECEVIMLTLFGGGERVFKKHFAQELRLMRSKWFDYRILHPVVATYRYAHEYTLAFRRYYSKVIDHQKGQFIKGFKGKDALASSSVTAFFTGRRTADQYGIPYDFYISTALNYLYVKKWKHLPRPCHLYAEDVQEAVVEKWTEYSQSALILAQDPFFKDASKRHLPEFQAHQDWLTFRLSLSKVKSIAAQSLIEQGYLLEP